VSRIERETEQSKYRWYLLLLSGLTATFAVAVPSMSIPVLFSEIAEDLGLSLVQIGAVWGTVSFAGLFTSLAGGTIGDRFGTRRTLAVACLLLGLTGASRGLSGGLATMTLTVFLCGLLSAAIPMNLHKVCAMWFSGRQLGKANAVVSRRDGARLHDRIADQRHGSFSLAWQAGGMFSSSTAASPFS